MKSTDKSPTRPHDLGGHPATSLDMNEDEVTFWEQRIDAMVNLLRVKGVITDWAQLRVGIELLDPQDYHRLSYYERWTVALTRIVVAQELVTEEEIKQKVQSLKEREG